MNIQDVSNISPGIKPTQEELIAFLNTMPLGVLSTLDSTGQPQGSTVAFSQTDKLELVVGTSELSRKSINMQSDPRVAFTVTDADRRYTVQYEGKAERLTSNEFDVYAGAHFDKLPASAPFRDIAGQCYFLIRPTYVRFTDCNPHPWVLTEFKL